MSVRVQRPVASQQQTGSVCNCLTRTTRECMSVRSTGTCWWPCRLQRRWVARSVREPSRERGGTAPVSPSSKPPTSPPSVRELPLTPLTHHTHTHTHTHTHMHALKRFSSVVYEWMNAGLVKMREVPGIMLSPLLVSQGT